MAADGQNIFGAGASSTRQNYTLGSSSYHKSNGSSYAAPQVSGAVALLASHFPNHTPEQLTDRLLASAKNDIGFAYLGRLEFGNGVYHDYSREAGHGVLDIMLLCSP